jgi:hypothetical protein
VTRQIAVLKLPVGSFITPHKRKTWTYTSSIGMADNPRTHAIRGRARRHRPDLHRAACPELFWRQLRFGDFDI